MLSVIHEEKIIKKAKKRFLNKNIKLVVNITINVLNKAFGVVKRKKLKPSIKDPRQIDSIKNESIMFPIIHNRNNLINFLLIIFT